MQTEMAYPQPDSSQTAHQTMSWPEIHDIFCADHAMLKKALTSRSCLGNENAVKNGEGHMWEWWEWLLTLIVVKFVIYMILHFWQAFRLSGTTFVINLNMFASLSFVNTICLWRPHTWFMWQILEERDPWLALQKSIFLCDYLAKWDGVFTEL